MFGTVVAYSTEDVHQVFLLEARNVKTDLKGEQKPQNIFLFFNSVQHFAELFCNLLSVGNVQTFRGF